MYSELPDTDPEVTGVLSEQVDDESSEVSRARYPMGRSRSP